MFHFENFRIGVNKYGFHFQDSQTGVIFTFFKAKYPRTFKIAICEKSAKERIRKELEKFLVTTCPRINKISNIPIENCYISPSLKFELKNIAADSIGIIHKGTEKPLGLINSTGNSPEVRFFFGEPDKDYDIVLKDFFDICSKEVDLVTAGRSYFQIETFRSWTLNQIHEVLYENITKKKEEKILSQDIAILVEKETKPLKKTLIKVVCDLKCEMKISVEKKLGRISYIGDSLSNCPANIIVYIKQVFKEYPYIKQVCFAYTSGRERKLLVVTPSEIDSEFKRFVELESADSSISINGKVTN